MMEFWITFWHISSFVVLGALIVWVSLAVGYFLGKIP